MPWASVCGKRSAFGRVFRSVALADGVRPIGGGRHEKKERDARHLGHRPTRAAPTRIQTGQSAKKEQETLVQPRRVD